MGLGLLGLFFMLAFFGVGVLGTVFWIWMLIDCAKNERSGEDRVVWIIIIAVTHLVGAAIYFFVRRQPRVRDRLR